MNENADRRMARSVTGDASEIDRLMPHVLQELRQIAERLFRDEPIGHTLQPTALINEAYLKLVGRPDLIGADRRIFLNAAAEGMRRILLDHARRRRAGKRGGDWFRASADVAELALSTDPSVVVQLDEAFEALQREAPEMADVVRLRLYGGLTIEQTSELLSVSESTVTRRWAWARAWIYRYLDRSNS
ncbi:MAG: ECF-type sigma factor [Phycisphaerae bacterium]